FEALRLAPLRIPSEGGEGGIQLVEKVEVLAVLRKAHVPRTSPGNGFGKVVPGDGGLLRIDSVNDDPVEAKVGDEGIAAVRRKTAPMGMRGVLAIPDHLG